LVKAVNDALKEGPLPEKVVSDIIDSIFVTMSDALAKGLVIPLDNIGTLNPIVSTAKAGRNPRTGEKMLIPAKNVVRFKISNILKNKINK
jgi:nucleoid DNA-binding protein